MPAPEPSPLPPQTRERRDFPPVSVALALISLTLFLALALAGIKRVHRDLLPASRATAPAPWTDTPLAEGDFESGALRERWYAGQAERLRTYGWVNRAEGVARIPLDRAIAIEAARLGGAR